MALRPGGSQLLADAQAKRFDTLLVYRIDRDGVLHVERSREVFSLGRGAAVTTARYRKRPTAGK